SFADVAIGYIRGTVFDFAIFGLLFENSNWISLVIIGTILAVITYFIFKWSILRFDIKTPGREQQQNTDRTLLKEKRYDEIASIVVKEHGGKENNTNVDNCITSRRIDLKETRDVDKNLLNVTDYTGVMLPVAK